MPIGLHEALADETISLFVDISRAEASLRQRMLGFLAELEHDLTDGMRAWDERGGRTGRFLQQSRGSIFSSYEAQAKMIGHELRDLATFTADGLVAGVNQVAGAKLMTRALTRAEIVALSDESLIRGGKVGEWMKGQKQSVARAFDAEIRMGMAQGETMDQMITRIRGGTTNGFERVEMPNGIKKRIKRRVGGAINGMAKTQAEALVRTSVQTVSNNILVETYKGNSDVIGGVQAMATLDKRTTPVCMSRDGASWDMPSGAPAKGSPRDEPFPGQPPWHWRCRTVLAPIVRSWEEMAKNAGGTVPRNFKERIPESVRASMGGPVAGGKTYNKWLKERPVDVQKEILGPSRYTLFKNGKITAHQLADMNGRPLSVAELRQRRNLVMQVPK